MGYHFSLNPTLWVWSMGAASEYWRSRKGFILAAIGSAIGLGNIWRFSWLTYRNGGGAFIIPYFIALIVVGVPLIILEFVLGNYFKGSSPKVFRKIREQFEVVGWIAIIDVFVIGLYYAVVLAWVLAYVGFSLTVAWGTVEGVGDLFNSLLGNPLLVGVTLAITWFITWLTVYKGIASGIERASLFAIPILWILSVALVIRGLTLPGSVEGINWYLTPNWAKLAEGKVWVDAFGQILFTLSVMAAPLVVYASYMPEKSELPNSAWITAFANCGFSFFFGFATWGIIGYLMQLQNVASPEQLGVPLGGGGLAFVTIPTAVTLLPGAPVSTMVFGTIFFVILWLAGYTSLISIVEPVYASFRDKLGVDRKTGVTVITLLSFILGLMFVFQPGLIDPVDFMAGSTNLIWVVFLEAVIAGYYFSLKKLRDYVNPYAELRLGPWFDVLIRYVAPIALVAILSYGLVTAGQMSPISAVVLIAIILASVVLAGMKWRGEEK